MSRPLLIIFLTILVNLIGFGIIIPLLPFYAQTFGASPLTIGLLFGSFSLAQLFASPVLGHWSDKWGRRPVLIFSLVGTVISFVMLAVAHSLTMLFAARIVGPALGGLFARISYTAPIWAAAAITVVATLLAWFWLPETVHRVNAVSGSPWRALRDLSGRADLRLLFSIDFLYWGSFAVYQTTFALFGARRFGFDATHTGYLLAAFGFLGVLVQAGLVGPVVKRLGEKRTLEIGLVFAAIGWGGSAMTRSLPLFIAMLVPGALGIGFCNPSLVSLVSGAAGRHEQGRVQGAAGALESLGRTIGPVWGNGLLQWAGEGMAYGSAALVLLGTAALTTRYRPRYIRDTRNSGGEHA